MSNATYYFVICFAACGLVGCDKLTSERPSQLQLDVHSQPAGAASANSDEEQEKMSRVAPGTPLRESDFKQTLRATDAEYVVVQVYLEACGACMTEALQLMKLEEQWRRDGVAILGMGMDETPLGPKAFFNSTGQRIKFPLYFAPWFAKQQQVLVTPTLFIYSADGRQLYRFDSQNADTSVVTAIDEKLAEMLVGK